MTVDNLAARARRLDLLVRGLMKEVVVIREADDPLLYLERQDYLAALRQAVGVPEGARVALARAQPDRPGAGRRGKTRRALDRGPARG
jgi:hypothetical protein